MAKIWYLVPLSNTPERFNLMLKLIEAYKANPSDANRLRLQRYLDKHPFAICCAPDHGPWLREQGFRTI